MRPHRLISHCSLVTCVLLALVLSTGCAVPDRQVVSQAHQIHSGLQPAVMTDPELNSYLAQVGQRIITTAHAMSQEGYGPEAHRSESADWMFTNQMQFHLVNSDTLNAFTTGGEHMYLYNELFQAARTEDELVAVMAHEYAHVYGRHVAKGMQRQYGLLGLAALGGAAGYAAGGRDSGMEYAGIAAAATLAVGQFVGMGFTRRDEVEADKLGFDFYVRGGWDPQQFPGFFQTMIDRGHDVAPEMMSSHPSLRNRVERARQWAAELPPEAAQWRRPPVADLARFQQLQRRANEVARTMPQDQTLAKAQQLLNAFPSCVAPVETPEQQQAQQQVMEEAREQQQQPRQRR